MIVGVLNYDQILLSSCPVRMIAEHWDDGVVAPRTARDTLPGTDKLSKHLESWN